MDDKKNVNIELTALCSCLKPKEAVGLFRSTRSNGQRGKQSKALFKLENQEEMYATLGKLKIIHKSCFPPFSLQWQAQVQAMHIKSKQLKKMCDACASNYCMIINQIPSHAL